MWCAGCQTNVAGEISADGQSLRCASCGGEVSSIKAPSLHPKTREVRELLERWSTEELLDPDLPVRYSPPAEPAVSSRDAPAEKPSASRNPQPAAAGASREHPPSPPDSPPEHKPAPTPARKKSRPKYRLDNEHLPKAGSRAPVPPPHPQPVHEQVPHMRRDGSHAHAPAPHFNIASAFEGKKAPGQGESVWGQVLAYAGVGLLTVGTVLVLWGYFGGPENYTPTGWLLATAGQMLLFLGVVTLVSGGMEQTTHEVSRHIQVLGDQIIRIERHTQEQLLRGPHFASGDESGSRPRQTADTRRQRSTDDS